MMQQKKNRNSLSRKGSRDRNLPKQGLFLRQSGLLENKAFLAKQFNPKLVGRRPSRERDTQRRPTAEGLLEDQNRLNPHSLTMSKTRIIKIEQFIYGEVNCQMRADFAAAVLKGVQYSTERLKAPSPAFVASFSTFLAEPTNSHRKFLLLDLDQTLIHTQRQPLAKTDGKVTLKMSVRPFAAQFLRQLSSHFEIYIFTAGQRGYAEAAVAKLNRKAVIIKDILSREHCFETRKGKFLKDLRIIRNRGLEDLVIVDNLVESFGLQLDNGVPILEFKGSEYDRELLGLIPFLKELSQSADVRPILQKKYGLLELMRGKRTEPA